MDEERLRFQGRLAEKQLKADELKLKIVGLRDSVRVKLDPFEPVEDLNIEVAYELMVDLAAAHIEYVEILGEIQAIKKALGK